MALVVAAPGLACPLGAALPKRLCVFNLSEGFQRILILSTISLPKRVLGELNCLSAMCPKSLSMAQRALRHLSCERRANRLPRRRREQRIADLVSSYWGGSSSALLSRPTNGPYASMVSACIFCSHPSCPEAVLGTKSFMVGSRRGGLSSWTWGLRNFSSIALRWLFDIGAVTHPFRKVSISYYVYVSIP